MHYDVINRRNRQEDKRPKIKDRKTKYKRLKIKEIFSDKEIQMKNMNIDDIIEFIRNNKKFLKEQFGVEKIGVFGSYVKNNFQDDSDIDIVIEMNKGSKTLHNFLELKRFLEKNLQREVDLGIESNLKKAIKKEILSEIVYA